MQNLSGRLSLDERRAARRVSPRKPPRTACRRLSRRLSLPRSPGLSISPDGGQGAGLDGCRRRPQRLGPAGGKRRAGATHQVREGAGVAGEAISRPTSGSSTAAVRPATTSHLFVRERDGKAVELVPGKATRFFGWAGDGKSFFVEAMNSSGPSWDLFRVAAAAGYEKTRLDRNSSHVSRLAAVSADGALRGLRGEVRRPHPQPPAPRPDHRAEPVAARQRGVQGQHPAAVSARTARASCCSTTPSSPSASWRASRRRPAR